MKLKDFANVRTGFVLSRKQADAQTGIRYPLLNLRCIQKEGVVNLNEADEYVAKEPLKEEYLSQKGDVVVRLSTPYTAVLIDESTSGMAFSSNFAVVRIKNENLLPGFLCWWLNTQEVNRTIYKSATSNILGTARANFLADLELIVPSIENQNKIARLCQLAKKEIQLLKELINEKEKLYSQRLEQIYENMKGETK